VWVEYDQEKMNKVWKDRWDPWKDEPIRDIAGTFYLMRKVANSDPSRLAAVRTLLKQHPRMIIFYNFDYELDMLRGLAGEIEFREWNGHKHEELPTTDKWVYACQYIAGAEGWNCTTTDCVVFWSLTYSYKLWEQAHGRIDRLDTPYTDLYYYALRSKAGIDQAVYRSLKSKRSFQNSEYEMTTSEFHAISREK
jgi:hypothetical protein